MIEFFIISMQALKAAASPLRGSLFGCLLTHSPPSMCHLASLNDSNWHVKGGSTKKM